VIVELLNFRLIGVCVCVTLAIASRLGTHPTGIALTI
jgi:hypothetical protein